MSLSADGWAGPVGDDAINSRTANLLLDLTSKADWEEERKRERKRVKAESVESTNIHK